MFTDDTLNRIIQDIRYAGEIPLLQYDILDSRILLQVIRLTPFPCRSHRRMAFSLRELGMKPIGLHSVEGKLCCLWVQWPDSTEIPVAGIVATARHRVREDLKELHMELVSQTEVLSPPPIVRPSLTAYERDVLSMRLRPQGLRHPRPREIAARLGGSVQQVNFALQRCRRLMGLRSMKNPAELRAAVKKSSILMDDPAFS